MALTKELWEGARVSQHSMLHVNMVCRGLLAATVLVGGNDRVLAIELETHRFRRQSTKCNPSTYLYPYTAAAKLRSRYALAKVADMTALRTIVIALVYRGSEGGDANTVYVGGARHHLSRIG